MGRLTEFFEAIKEGINKDTESLFSYIDTTKVKRLLKKKHFNKKRFVRKHKWYPGKYPGWRQGVEYQAWRKDVLWRDNWTCVQCRQVGGVLCAHHVLSGEIYEKQRFNINNGVTLCVICHNSLHGERKRKFKRRIS